MTFQKTNEAMEAENIEVQAYALEHELTETTYKVYIDGDKDNMLPCTFYSAVDIVGFDTMKAFIYGEDISPLIIVQEELFITSPTIKFTVEIESSNNSFDNGNHNKELARILHDVANGLEFQVMGNYQGKLRDENGNSVGSYKLEIEE